jgi:hypothetical protein
MQAKSRLQNSCQVKHSFMHTKFENENNKKRKRLEEKYQSLNHIKIVAYSLFAAKNLLSINTCKLELAMQFRNNKLCLAT